MYIGDELVELTETPVGSQIRDSNRLSLITSLKADGYTVLDLGIARDQASSLEAKLIQSVEVCDVLITSGGVSMGDADLVKPTLAKLGTVHFGRLNMKPGKPTTFAAITSKDKSKMTYIFALPGNPVSCMVTKALLIDPCLRRLQGLSVEQCMPPQLEVRLETTLKLDPERPEYHRAIVSSSSYPGATICTAVSTGSQRSSRLLSMRCSNALLCLPKGTEKKTHINTGEIVTALLTGPIPSPSPSVAYHKAMFQQSIDPAALPAGPPTSLPAEPVNSSIQAVKEGLAHVRPIAKIGLLTISDRVSID